MVQERLRLENDVTDSLEGNLRVRTETFGSDEYKIVVYPIVSGVVKEDGLPLDKLIVFSEEAAIVAHRLYCEKYDSDRRKYDFNVSQRKIVRK